MKASLFFHPLITRTYLTYAVITRQQQQDVVLELQTLIVLPTIFILPKPALQLRHTLPANHSRLLSPAIYAETVQVGQILAILLLVGLTTNVPVRVFVMVKGKGQVTVYPYQVMEGLATVMPNAVLQIPAT
jgi:hypothetical protein